MAQASTSRTDFRRSDGARIKAYRASLAIAFDPPQSRTWQDQRNWETGSQWQPGHRGHRDGFFRVLKEIKKSDMLQDGLPRGKDTYSVDVIEIIDKSDVSVLRAGPLRTVTLITGHPFYFVGSAPDRFVVKASLPKRELRQPRTSAQR